jgi:hypothetical protein
VPVGHDALETFVRLSLQELTFSWRGFKLRLESPDQQILVACLCDIVAYMRLRADWPCAKARTLQHVAH